MDGLDRCSTYDKIMQRRIMKALNFLVWLVFVLYTV